MVWSRSSGPRSKEQMSGLRIPRARRNRRGVQRLDAGTRSQLGTGPLRCSALGLRVDGDQRRRDRDADVVSEEAVVADPCHRASFYSEGDQTWTYYCVLDAGHDAAL